MTTAIKRRRGTTAQHATFTGLEGELTVDTTKDVVVVHDGATAGGFPMAKDSTVVHTTGNETIAGTKTFSSDASISGLTVGKGGGTTTNSTAVGSLALASNSGDYNTAIGRFALNGNTTGTGNTGVGYLAIGNAANTGSANTGIGYNSLISNTSGSSNTALGASVLQANTTGGQNTSVGFGSLNSNTTASYNTAVGYQAGYSNTTGIYQVYIGQGAGFSNTVGTGQTYVGQGAGYYATGNYNTFFGFGAGANITTGSKNTILGAYSGNQGGLDIRTSSNYIVLSDGDGNPRQIIDGSGNVGIGGATQYAASNRTTLNVNGTNTALIGVSSGGSTTTASYLYWDGSLAHLASTTALAFETVATERMRITSAGVVELAQGQIKFPATQSASSDANTLDDYEEGTWTPTIVGSTSAGTGTYGTQVASYTKIGNIVQVQAYIDWSGHTGTGNLFLGNLPFTTTSTANNFGGVSIGYINNITLTALNIATAYTNVNATTIALYQTPVGGGASTAVPIRITGNIIYTAVYKVA